MDYLGFIQAVSHMWSAQTNPLTQNSPPCAFMKRPIHVNTNVCA